MGYKNATLIAGRAKQTRVAGCVNQFGTVHKVPHLAEVVLDLYDAALKASSKKTYGTGQRAYGRFIRTLAEAAHLPFLSRQLNQTELTLAFFMAHLVLKPTIKVGTTILNYETHVKYYFREEGCSEIAYSTPFLRQIRQGVQKTLPSRADDRRALLLPSMIKNPEFQKITSPSDILFRFATIIGFMGMLRPHTMDQLNPDSFFILLGDGQRVRMRGSGNVFRRDL